MPLRLAGGRGRTCPHCGRTDDHLHLRPPPPAPAAPPVRTVPRPARRSRRPGIGQLALWNTTAWNTTAWDTTAAADRYAAGQRAPSGPPAVHASPGPLPPCPAGLPADIEDSQGGAGEG